MEVLEPGHIYKLDVMDSEPDDNPRLELVFLNRPCDNPNHECGVPHAGTQSQEVLRALIDRAKHVDTCLHWEGNGMVVYHLSMALAWLEARALIRKVEKQQLPIEKLPVGADGHIIFVKEIAHA